MDMDIPITLTLLHVAVVVVVAAAAAEVVLVISYLFPANIYCIPFCDVSYIISCIFNPLPIYSSSFPRGCSTVSSASHAAGVPTSIL